MSIAEAIYGLEQAISLVEEGNKKWPKISYEKKGSSLSPSFLRMMKAELLCTVSRSDIYPEVVRRLILYALFSQSTV